jgi:glycerol-3-phosphate dehydrogenase
MVTIKNKIKRFSVLDRKEHLQKVASEKFDIVVIGGGVTGAGIALDAVSRGLKVCLIEKNDFASGTSNKSTKLIHGGLRYLKQFEIGLVRESGMERSILHKLVPHLVLPEKMLLPLVKGGTYGKVMTSIGLKVYDFLAGVKGDDQRKMLTKKTTLIKEPMLNSNVVVGGGLYAEYRTDDARLTIEIIKKAADFGATILNYCEMESFGYDENSKIESLNCIDNNTQNRINIKAENFVSAAGPWVDLLRKKDNSINNKYLHLTKGVHIVFPYEKLPVQQAMYFDVPDGRMIFAIPRGRVTYVGTTDTNYKGSLDRVVATKTDATYLLDAVNSTFSGVGLSIEDIESNWAGLRPLIHEEGKDPSELSRKDEIFISKSGLISIAGGKLTGYRKMASRVVDRVVETISSEKQERLKKVDTRKIAMVSPALENAGEVVSYQIDLETQLTVLGIENRYYADYLCSNYGMQSDDILEKMDEITKGTPLEKLIRAELWYSVHNEMTTNLVDFFVRRTGRLYFDLPSVKEYLTLVLEDFVTYFHWNEEKTLFEKGKMEVLIEDASSYYDKEF